jgi:hypothetical protein
VGVVGGPGCLAVLLGLQRLWEKLSLRYVGDHQSRRSLPIVERVGFTVTASRRSKLGTVEEVHVTRPAVETR